MCSLSNCIGSQVGAQRSAADNEWPNGTLVWASLARYPYWPAYVLKGDENGTIPNSIHLIV